MNQPKCKDCAHFIQHYALDKRKIYRVYCGHCIRNAPKQKRPDAKACENFIPSPPPEEAFASKEYLSKELLQYVLSLDLLPKIEEQG